MEATVQILSTPLPGEEPFIGDAEESELIANSSDGRLWIGNVSSNPIELGGSCVNKPINGNLFSGNYLDLDVTNPDNMPIPVPDPNNVPPGFYRELRILLRFVGNPLETLTTYFDYDVDWGDPSFWSASQETWGGLNRQQYSSPLDFYAKSGSVAMIELSCFGPSPAWRARLLWAK